MGDLRGCVGMLEDSARERKKKPAWGRCRAARSQVLGKACKRTGKEGGWCEIPGPAAQCLSPEVFLNMQGCLPSLLE